MDALIGRLCDRLEAGGTRLGTAVATIWRGGRTTDPETPATTVHIITYIYQCSQCLDVIASYKP